MIRFLIFTSLFAGSSSLALAQNGPIVVPINNWSYLRHSSTATEGYLRGTADAVRAAGQANYLGSVAAVNMQEANRLRIENHHLYVRKYLENKELNRQYRAKYASVPPNKEQWARITAASLPDRLGEDQFDHTTGDLVWPHILRQAEYAAIRERVDELLASRSPQNSGDGSPLQRELAGLVDGMQMLLKNNSSSMSSAQFAAANWFLKSLQYEAQLPMQPSPSLADQTVSDAQTVSDEGADADTDEIH